MCVNTSVGVRRSVRLTPLYPIVVLRNQIRIHIRVNNRLTIEHVR